jgi:ketosteroid isomerase-like protein
MLTADGAQCGVPGARDDSSMSNLDTVRHMLACFSAGDAPGQLEHCADDVVYEAPYYGLERRGKTELAAMLAAVQERFDEVSYVIVDDFPTVDPDLVIVEVHGNSKVRGVDTRYQNHYIMFLYFRDGLVHRWREFSNPDVYRTAVTT